MAESAEARPCLEADGYETDANEDEGIIAQLARATTKVPAKADEHPA